MPGPRYAPACGILRGLHTGRGAWQYGGMAKKKLNPKQLRFCREYVIDHNGTQAAIRAGYSKRTAKEQAYDLLTKPHVQGEIAKLEEKATKRLDKTADDVLRELALLGFSNMADFMRILPSGDPCVDLSEMTREQAAALTEATIEDFTDGRGESARDVRRVKIKLADKRAALVELGKHFGLFKGEDRPPDVTQNITINLVRASDA